MVGGPPGIIAISNFGSERVLNRQRQEHPPKERKSQPRIVTGMTSYQVCHFFNWKLTSK